MAREPGRVELDASQPPLPGREISDDHVGELSRLGLDYWWYAVRLGHVESCLRRCAGRAALDYLDFGCGEGKVTARIVAGFEPRRWLALDGTRGAVDAGRARGLPVRLADFRRPLELDFAPNAITCLDVLEHLEDPQQALRHLALASDPSATLIVTVPAMPSLYSRWDDVSGHRRRYTRSLLLEHLCEGGWRPERVRYFFGYCVAPAWIERRLLRRVRRFEFPDYPAAVNRLLTLAGHLERRLGSPSPFGTSLLAVATRRAKL